MTQVSLSTRRGTVAPAIVPAFGIDGAVLRTPAAARDAALRAEIEALRQALAEATERLRRLEPVGADRLLGSALGLTETQTRIVALLLQRPSGATREALMTVLYGLDDRAPDATVLKTHICFLRKRLARHALEIRTIATVGYALTRESFAVLTAMRAALAPTPDAGGDHERD